MKKKIIVSPPNAEGVNTEQSCDRSLDDHNDTTRAMIVGEQSFIIDGGRYDTVEVHKRACT